MLSAERRLEAEIITLAPVWGSIRVGWSAENPKMLATTERKTNPKISHKKRKPGSGSLFPFFSIQPKTPPISASEFSFVDSEGFILLSFPWSKIYGLESVVFMGKKGKHRKRVQHDQNGQ